eukprot:4062461-Prymnesium_polylepis.2
MRHEGAVCASASLHATEDMSVRVNSFAERWGWSYFSALRCCDLRVGSRERLALVVCLDSKSQVM